MLAVFFFFKQKTAYEMRISDWSSDVCSSDLVNAWRCGRAEGAALASGHAGEGYRVVDAGRPRPTGGAHLPASLPESDGYDDDGILPAAARRERDRTSVV